MAQARWTTKAEGDAGLAGVIDFSFDGDTWHEPAGVRSPLSGSSCYWRGPEPCLVLEHSASPPDQAGWRWHLSALAALSEQAADPRQRYRGLAAECARCLGDGG